MKNYNTMLTENTTKSELIEIIDNHKNDVLDNIESELSLEKVVKVVETINKATEKEFYTHFCYTLDLSDRKSAFTELVKTPCFEWLTVEEKDGYFIIKDDKTKLVSFAKLEKAYQVFKSTETDKNGKPIANKSVTIFEALRVYGLVDTFTRNLTLDIIKVDGIKYDLTRIKISDTTIFTEKDGECFASNSKTALDKQLNIIVKFFGLDVTMRKTDLAIIKQLVLKIRQDKTSAKFSAKEQNTFKMIDIIFGVICSRMANEDVKIEVQNLNKDGKKEWQTVKEINTTK